MSWIIFLQGIAQLILGILLLMAPGATTVILVQFLGIYWLISGVISIGEIFVGNKQTSWGWLLAGGIFGILAGLLVLSQPLFSAVITGTFIIVWIAVLGIIQGIVNIVRGFSGSGFWAIILGLISLLIGMFLLFNPLQTVIALPIVLGIFSAVGGAILIVLSFGLDGSKNS